MTSSGLSDIKLRRSDLEQIFHAISQCPAFERPSPHAMRELRQALERLGGDPGRYER
jgi:hypothetical protein